MKKFYLVASLTVFGATLFWLNPVSGQQPDDLFQRKIKSNGGPGSAMMGGSGMMGMTRGPAADDGVQGLLHAYKESKEEKTREDIRGQIIEIVEKQFDDRQKQREEELVQLEERVRQLREVHDLRDKEKQQIVTDRVHQMLREALGLGWGVNNWSMPGAGFGGGGMDMMPGGMGGMPGMGMPGGMGAGPAAMPTKAVKAVKAIPRKVDANEKIEIRLEEKPLVEEF